MTNNSIEKLNVPEKSKPGYVLEEVPAGKKGQGTSLEELGSRWGKQQGPSRDGGRVTRSGSLVPYMIPGSLEPAQEERGTHPESSGSNLPGVTGSGHPEADLDQPASTGGDQSIKEGPDQSDNSDGDL